MQNRRLKLVVMTGVLASCLMACNDKSTTDVPPWALGGSVQAYVAWSGTPPQGVTSITARVSNIKLYDAAGQPQPVAATGQEAALLSAGPVNVGGGPVPAGTYSFASATVEIVDVAISGTLVNTDTGQPTFPTGTYQAQCNGSLPPFESGQQSIRSGSFVVDTSATAPIYVLSAAFQTAVCQTAQLPDGSPDLEHIQASLARAASANNPAVTFSSVAPAAGRR